MNGSALGMLIVSVEAVSRKQLLRIFPTLQPSARISQHDYFCVLRSTHRLEAFK